MPRNSAGQQLLDGAAPAARALQGNLAEIRHLAADPELQDELLAQQRMIHEQQRHWGKRRWREMKLVSSG